ncbi:hypothetical protein VCHC72A2_03429A, partial [Vibrio cholerae HC-72A2]|jgi:peptidoglycan/LPS O-acetylase OafA/YrhL
MKHL